MKSNRKVVAASLGAVLVVAAVAVVAIFALRPPPTPQLVTAMVKMGDIEDAVLATGALQPFTVIDVGSQASGQVLSVKVKLGDKVTAGQLLANIEPRNQLNQIRNQETQLAQQRRYYENQMAQVALQESNMQRQQALKDKGVGLGSTYDQAVAQLRQARASLAQAESQIKTREVELENAQNNLERTNIRAPIDGIVAEVVARQGTTVNANQTTPTIVRLAKMDVMTVRAQISEADIIKVKPGQKVYFTILGDPKRRFYATLRTRELTPANGVLDPGANGAPKGAIYYNALFEVPNRDGVLLPAMTAEVHVVLNEAHNVMTIPAVALGPQQPDGSYAVQVVGPDGKVATRKVTIGLNNNFTAEVKSGLKVGEQVVVGEATATAKPASASRGPLFGNAFAQP